MTLLLMRIRQQLYLGASEERSVSSVKDDLGSCMSTDSPHAHGVSICV